MASRKQAKNYTKECYLLARRRWRNSSRILQGEENEVTKYENDEVVSIALPASWTRFDFWLKKKKKSRQKLEVERIQFINCTMRTQV